MSDSLFTLRRARLPGSALRSPTTIDGLIPGTYASMAGEQRARSGSAVIRVSGNPRNLKLANGMMFSNDSQ